MSHQELEEGATLTLDFQKITAIANRECSVIPVAVQNVETKEVILVAYTNEEAFNHTVTTGTATFWSTSRNELWIKGATSGATFEVVDIFVNCEQNSLLYTVRPQNGGICHTKNSAGEPRNCYYRKLIPHTKTLKNINS